MSLQLQLRPPPVTPFRVVPVKERREYVHSSQAAFKTLKISERAQFIAHSQSIHTSPIKRLTVDAPSFHQKFPKVPLLT